MLLFIRAILDINNIPREMILRYLCSLADYLVMARDANCAS